MRLTERVSKRIDFAKERRAQGRPLNAGVRELARLIEPVARQHGIDLQARLKEALARKSEERRLLAERLQESVVPLFIGDSSGRPDRIGSCVLVRLAYRLDDPGTAGKSLAERFPFAQTQASKMFGNRVITAQCADARILLS